MAPRAFRPSREGAEAIAVAALGYLAAEPDRLQRFLGLSGLGPGNLRAAAADPNFLASVLDYILADEPLLIGFASAEPLAPEAVVAARQALDTRTPGGSAADPP